MKKTITFLMALILGVSFLTACGAKEEPPATQPSKPTETTNQTQNQTDAPQKTGGALEILETVWGLYGEEDKFAAIGGDENNFVDGAPGIYDITNTETLMFGLLVPQGQIPHLQEAASLVHGMNSNVLSAAAFRLTEGTDLNAFATEMREAIQGNQWLCGFPDKLLVAVVGENYVVTAFGQEPLETFAAKLKQAYPSTQVLYDEAVR